MISLVVTATDQCNLSCRYCYTKKCKQDGVISDDILRQLFMQVRELRSDKINFYWQGGEVLLLGLDFFKRVKSFQEEMLSGKKYHNHIQTNGTLLDREYIRFFKENGFHVGISMDGPKELHDGNRVFKDGSGTHDCIMKAVEVAKEEGLRTGFLTVLTRENAKKIGDIYRFFSERDFSFRVNPVVAQPGRNLEPTPAEYGNALIRLYDLACETGGQRRIQPLESYERMIMSNKPCGCHHMLECHKSIVGIDYNGDIYNCNRFIGLESQKLGNLKEDSIKDIINSKRTEAVCQRHLDSMGCGDCEWKSICNGGCPYSAYMNYGSRNVKDYYCEGYRMVLSHIRSRLAGSGESPERMLVCPPVLYEEGGF